MDRVVSKIVHFPLRSQNTSSKILPAHETCFSIDCFEMLTPAAKAFSIAFHLIFARFGAQFNICQQLQDLIPFFVIEGRRFSINVSPFNGTLKLWWRHKYELSKYDWPIHSDRYELITRDFPSIRIGKMGNWWTCMDNVHGTIVHEGRGVQTNF